MERRPLPVPMQQADPGPPLPGPLALPKMREDGGHAVNDPRAREAMHIAKRMGERDIGPGGCPKCLKATPYGTGGYAVLNTIPLL